MLELEENLKFLNELKNKLEEIKDSMKIESLKFELNKLEKESLSENFWNNQENSTLVFSKIKKLQKKIGLYESLESELINLIEMNELLNLEPEEELIKELLLNSQKINEQCEKLEIETLLSGNYDFNNAIITMHPGSYPFLLYFPEIHLNFTSCPVS